MCSPRFAQASGRHPNERQGLEPITFHEFASRWWTARKAQGLALKTQQDYEWRLRKHLLPFFADYPVAEIDRELVDRYREGKLIEREQMKAAAAAGCPMRNKHGQRRQPLNNGSINKTLATRAQILEQADELRELLAMAAEVDQAEPRYQIGRRPMIAVMAMAGLRVTEMCRLRWRDVDVHHRRLVIRQAKTDAGVREVDLSLDLMEELISWRALGVRGTSPGSLVPASRWSNASWMCARAEALLNLRVDLERCPRVLVTDLAHDVGKRRSSLDQQAYVSPPQCVRA